MLKTNFHHRAASVAAILGLTSLLTARTQAQAPSPVNVTVDANAPGPDISPEFSGLSFETQLLLPDASGRHYFRPDNKPLVALFKTLGITCLRVGGNTSDSPTVPLPATADIDSLFAFAQAASVKVIYTLRLKGEPDPTEAAKTAKYIMDHYGPTVMCFAVGNEPNIYFKTYDAYKTTWGQYLAAITAPDAAPNALFCGPSATPGKTSWPHDFASDFAKTGKIKFVTQHAYPGGSAKKVTDPAAAREKLLSPALTQSYAKMYQAFVPAVLADKLPYRMEEANSFFNGGAKDASDTQASALWGLDYLYWWASHGASGLNFHTGDRVAAGKSSVPSRYATYTTSPKGYLVHPLGYAIKAFDLGSHGRLLGVNVASGETRNLTAYAVAGADHALYVTLINKEYGPGEHGMMVLLHPGGAYASGSAMFLTAPGDDVAATSGVTLGGSEIGADASWHGTWTPLPKASTGGLFTVTLPAATAAVVKLTRP